MVQRRASSSVRIAMTAQEGASATCSSASGTNEQTCKGVLKSSAGAASSVTHASSPPNLYADRWEIALLVLLYTIQGLPMGFVFGSIPFLLKERIGYDALAVFSFAGWPYSLKLLVAPVVDSVYSRRIGRRKSWILPAQTLSGTLMLTLGPAISRWVQTGNVTILTPVFFTIMSVTACQDIAVDSWALTLLQPGNLPYASACQSVGLGIGFFASFTIFLALQDASFSDAYIRPWSGGSGPVVSLSGMIQGIGFFYLVITVAIHLLKSETGAAQVRKTSSTPTSTHPDAEALLPSFSVSSMPLPHVSGAIAETYMKLFEVIKLPAIRQLVVVLLLSKLTFSAHDNVSGLKLLDNGFPKQTMAMMAVFQAPVSLLTSIWAGRLVANHGPVKPFMCGFVVRAILALSGPPLVARFRILHGAVTSGFYAIFLLATLLYSIGSDLMFVSMSALFLSVGDKDIGGSYLTLLATCSNMGGMWHKPITLFLVERLTFYKACVLPSDGSVTVCPVALDGYYIISTALAPVAIPTGMYMYRCLTRLTSLPKSAWRVTSER